MSDNSLLEFFPLCNNRKDDMILKCNIHDKTILSLKKSILIIILTSVDMISLKNPVTIIFEQFIFTCYLTLVLVGNHILILVYFLLFLISIS